MLQTGLGQFVRQVLFHDVLGVHAVIGKKIYQDGDDDYKKQKGDDEKPDHGSAISPKLPPCLLKERPVSSCRIFFRVFVHLEERRPFPD